MSDIRPLDLPTAAGMDFGSGDVRHFSEDDAVNVPGLQNPTRMLAERDNLIAVKLNEVVTEVNNKEQVVPLPIPRTGIPSSTEEVVFNFKIPDGFEARILSAAIGSSPVTTDLTLKIYFSTGYGNTTGTELVSTTGSFDSGVAFYNTGEFIVAVVNDGSQSLDAVASVILTVRPMGSEASLLVGSIIRGARGYTGGRGDKGDKGDPGVGGAGTPGLSWAGTFSSATSYNPPQAVYYTRENGSTESYIAIAANPSPAKHPTDSAYWDPLAAGAAAVLTWRGPWTSGQNYYLNDAVKHNGSSYICIQTVINSTVNPATDTTNFDLLAEAGTDGTDGTSVSFASQPVGFPAADGGSLASTAPAEGDYELINVGGLPGTITGKATEYCILGGPDDSYPGRYVIMNGAFLAKFVGTLSITMPVSYYTQQQYTQSNVQVTATAQGDQPVPFPSPAGTHAGGVRIDWPSSTQVDIIVTETVGEQKVVVNATGFQIA